LTLGKGRATWTLAMAFSSNFFLFAFLPVALAIYFATPAQFRNPVLLAIGLVFYSFDTGWLTWLLVVSILLNHVAAKAIVRTEGVTRHAVFTAAVVVNLALLFHYKYTKFAWIAAAPLFEFAHYDIGRPADIVLPIGISFFTFQALSYITDVYRGQIAPARRLLDFGMYHSLFPQLIAGPIVRYAEVESEVYKRVSSLNHVADGIFRFCIGLGKKIIIADNMGAVVDPIFALPHNELSAPIAWLGILCYTLQIFFDFSGYSDMAIGLGRILGFEFPENFNLPYRARSFTEYWHRWHMTLSRWFRDYVYIPLGGNRHGPARTYVNLFVVFLLCGLWHGAGYTFVAWGLYHGTMLVIERVYRNRFGRLPEGVVAWAVTFLLLMLSWVLFRAPDLPTAMHYYATMFGLSQPSAVYYGFWYFLNPQKAAFLVCGLLFALAPLEGFRYRLQGNALTVAGRCVFSVAVYLYAVVLLSANSFNPFIYFRF
jgi:alginate O-acetyltransferase complex protein AlgI